MLIARNEWDSLGKHADVEWLSRKLTGAAQVKYVEIPKATHLMHLENGRMALYAAIREIL